MPEPQNYKNHGRFDPPWHFFAAPFSLLNLVFAIVITIHHWPQHRVLFLWYILVSIAFIVTVVKTRTNALKVQDRIIRLEEQLRYQSLLSPADLARSRSLTIRQIIGLRFASDDELPALVKRALDEGLTEKQIKQAITNWRADTFRV